MIFHINKPMKNLNLNTNMARHIDAKWKPHGYCHIPWERGC